MNNGLGAFVPFSFDLSELVRRSVASLYSHLITRPTGRALRFGIESQIGELGALCVSVLDFSQVRVLDYSCADEAVAKLILRYQQPDRPADAYFVARGVDDAHRGTLEAVLERHGLALVIESGGTDAELLGSVNAIEFDAWSALEELTAASAVEIAAQIGTDARRAAAALETLAEQRVIIRSGEARCYALRCLLASDTD